MYGAYSTLVRELFASGVSISRAALRLSPLSQKEWKGSCGDDAEMRMRSYTANPFPSRFEQVMPLLAAEGIIPLAISFLHAYHSSLAREVQMAGCMFLSASFDAEDARKLPQESNAKLREFMPLLLEQLNLGASERRQLRPLFDELRRGG